MRVTDAMDQLTHAESWLLGASLVTLVTVLSSALII